jgi:hypothetical protein
VFKITINSAVTTATISVEARFASPSDFLIRLSLFTSTLLGLQGIVIAQGNEYIISLLELAAKEESLL